MNRRASGAVAAALLAVVSAAGCAEAPRGGVPPDEGPPPYDPAAASATLLVRAVAPGPLPRMRNIRFEADAEAAAQNPDPVPDPTVVAADGRLANVVAWVSRGADRWTFAAPGDGETLEIVRCMFTPHVLALRTGQSLAVKNAGRCDHTVRFLTAGGEGTGLRLPRGAPPAGTSFEREDVAVRVKDDVHGWMKAWIAVLPHPFFGVTGTDGTTAIRVPPGDYEVSAWHEYGKFAKPAPQNVTVAAGETKEIEFAWEVAR